MTARAEPAGTWQASAAPSTWPQVGIAVSCATGEDCWISAADLQKLPVAEQWPSISSAYDRVLGPALFRELREPRAPKWMRVEGVQEF